MDGWLVVPVEGGRNPGKTSGYGKYPMDFIGGSIHVRWLFGISENQQYDLIGAVQVGGLGWVCLVDDDK